MTVAAWDHPHSWALMSTHWHSWVFISPYERSWACHHGGMSSQDHSRAHMAPWNNTLKCSWEPISSHKHSCVLMRDQEYSLVLMNAKVFDSTINRKCWLLEWPPFSILPVQILQDYKKFDIFKFKNVQDFHPSPRDSEKSPQTKGPLFCWTPCITKKQARQRSTNMLRLIQIRNMCALLGEKKILQSRKCPVQRVLCQCTIVFVWKCRRVCLSVHGQYRVYYIYHVEFPV